MAERRQWTVETTTNTPAVAVTAGSVLEVDHEDMGSVHAALLGESMQIASLRSYRGPFRIHAHLFDKKGRSVVFLVEGEISGSEISSEISRVEEEDK